MKKILLLLMLISCYTTATENNTQSPVEKIKLYAFYTPSHKVFVDQWFLKTLQDDYVIIFEYHDQECASGDFMTDGWINTMLKKIDLIIRGIQENWNKFFIHADVDIQFFRPTKGIISQMMQDNDMIIQKDAPFGEACAGFFACKGNKKTLALWQEIKRRLQDKNYLKTHIRTNDQRELNNLIRLGNPFKIRWQYLPADFFGGGTFTGKLWNPKDILRIPDNIFMHHANWTIGINNKIAQLEYVRKLVEKRSIH